MDSREQISFRQRIVGILKIRSLRYIILGQMLLFLGFAGLFSTVTIYLQRVADLDAKAATSLTGPVGSVGLIAGAIVGAIIGDRVAKKNRAGRVTIGGICLALSAVCVAGFVLAPALPIKIVLFIAINAFNISALSNIGACTADVLPASKRGSGFAIAQFLITIGSSLGALLVFTISQVVVSSLGQGETAEALRTGITYGIASLIVPLTVGSLLIFRARSSFNRDADAALAETMGGTEKAVLV
jgi:MFS family permease